MKRIMIFLMLIFSFFLVACSKNNPRVAVKEENMQKKTVERIKELYCNVDNRKNGGLTNKDLTIIYYFGNYGKDKDAYVVMIKNHAISKLNMGPTYYYVYAWDFRKEGSKSFKFVRRPVEIEVVCEDEIYTLNKAVYKEMLNLEDIENIYNKFIEIDEVKKYYE